ncbi:flagellar protein FliT [Clostridium sp. AWRP]|nr:flagellar protein FliT [Clostridium sp. AWRP]
MMDLYLEKDMENLRNITCELINKLENDDYDGLESLMGERQKLLDNLKELNCTKKQYNDAVKQFKIIDFQNKLSKMMFEKKKDLRRKIDDISQKRTLTKSYSRHIGTTIFSKKI